MKRFLLYIATSVLLVSCFVKEDFIISQDEGGIKVFVASGAPDTKTTVTDLGPIAGEADMNENYLETLDLFFYRGDAAQDAAAVYHRFVVAGQNDSYQVSEIINEELIQTIFGSLTDGATSEVYVIANLWTTDSQGKKSRFADDASRAALRQTVISADFSRVNAENPSGIKESSFVMEGGSTITLVKSGGHYFVSGSVALYRTAAKVRLEITVPDAVNNNVAGSVGVTDGNGFVWKAKPEMMQVMLVHGANKGIVFSTNYDNNTYSYGFSDPDIYYGTDEATRWANYGHTMAETGRKVVGLDDSSNELYGTKYEHEVPFYSYPTQDWKATPANEAYLMLMLPWVRESKPSGETEPYLFTNTYYQIPIPQNEMDPTYFIKSNRYYRMEVTVGILGSFHIEDVVTLSPNTFIIFGWDINGELDPTVSNVSMSQTSYLAVSTNVVEMANIPTGAVEYASSHEVTAQFTKLEFYSYYDDNLRDSATDSDRIRRVVYELQTNGNWRRTVYDAYSGNTINGQGSTNAGNPFTSTGTYGKFPLGGYSLSVSDGKVSMTHNIPATQFVPATITVSLTNSKITDPEIITFTQYPSIYIDGHRSNGSVWVNNRTNGNTAYDDVGSGNSHYLGTARSNADGTRSGNNNRNLYTIHISSFSASDEYILGDPRVLNPVSLPNLSGTNDHYRPAASAYSTGSPTPSGTDDTENMVSPAFMIASSYGKTQYTYLTYDLAKKRCAAYQEDGYPAGRWRMPTAAEVKYIMTLSAQSYIPSLFTLTQNDRTGYWCANGKIQGNNQSLPYLGTNTSNTAVRCVYDVWYWGEEPYQENATTWLGYQY
ncbi:MAG: hypothetical protein IKR72_02200 [Bacteroidales bacterium]|nr:hypothetical protein [Bacteroidales bacterium]